MNALAGTRGPALPAARDLGVLAATVPLAAAGYLMFSDVRIAGAALGGVALVIWMLYAYRHPRAAIYASLALLFIAGTKFRLREPDASLGGSVDAQILFELAAYGAIGAAAAAAWASRWAAARLNAAELVFAAYVPFALLSALWSEAPTLTLVRGVQLGILAVAASAMVRVLGAAPALRASSLGVGGYVLICATLAVTVPWAAPLYESREDRFRFAWFAVHPIEVGTFAGLAAIGMIALLWWRCSQVDRPRTRAWIAYPIAATAIAVLALTNSRGPLLAFAAAAAVLAFFKLPARFRPAAVVLGSVPVVLVLASGLDPIKWLIELTARDGVLAKFLLQGQTADDLLAMNGRMELWDAVAPQLAANGVFGVGYQASRSVLLESAYWTPAYAHNALMQSLLDLGIVGTLPLFALVAMALSAACRSRLSPEVRATVTALSVFLVLNSVSTESYAGAPGFDFFVLAVCALSARQS